MNIISAVDLNWGIGKGNDLLFDIPEDKSYFRETTLNKTVIMGRKTFQSLPFGALPKRRNIILSTCHTIENNNIESTANYSYEVILNTFKFCSPTINKALRTNSWSNEMHRFNYVLKIVESNINNVYLRMKNVQKTKEEAKNTTIDTANYTGAEYQRKTKEVNNELLNDLW